MECMVIACSGVNISDSRSGGWWKGDRILGGVVGVSGGDCLMISSLYS
jgi:hypothetical protein